MTPDEIVRLLAVCPLHRRLLYETACLSGLRVNELRHLTTDHLDLERGGLLLDAQWTKNRKSGYQPVPKALAQRLHAFAESGEPARLYTRNLRRGGSQNTAPDNPLLYVPSHPAKILDQDLVAAGIPKRMAGGKLDFHALRTAYVNLVFEYGQVSPKEAQDLARHSTPDLTFNVYGRTRDERLSEAVERLAEAVFPAEGVPGEYRQAVGAETEIATPLETESCDPFKMAPAVGLEPTTWWLTATRSAN